MSNIRLVWRLPVLWYSWKLSWLINYNRNRKFQRINFYLPAGQVPKFLLAQWSFYLPRASGQSLTSSPAKYAYTKWTMNYHTFELSTLWLLPPDNLRLVYWPIYSWSELRISWPAAPRPWPESDAASPRRSKCYKQFMGPCTLWIKPWDVYTNTDALIFQDPCNLVWSKHQIYGAQKSVAGNCPVNCRCGLVQMLL